MLRWWVSSGDYITLYITKIFTNDFHVGMNIFIIALHKFHVSAIMYLIHVCKIWSSFLSMDLLQTFILQLYSGTAQILAKKYILFSTSCLVFVWKKDTFFTLMKLADDTETKRFFQIFDPILKIFLTHWVAFDLVCSRNFTFDF